MNFGIQRGRGLIKYIKFVRISFLIFIPIFRFSFRTKRGVNILVIVFIIIFYVQHIFRLYLHYYNQYNIFFLLLLVQLILLKLDWEEMDKIDCVPLLIFLTLSRKKHKDDMIFLHPFNNPSACSVKTFCSLFGLIIYFFSSTTKTMLEIF